MVRHLVAAVPGKRFILEENLQCLWWREAKLRNQIV